MQQFIVGRRFRFLDLPDEVRKKIYELLLCNFTTEGVSLQDYAFEEGQRSINASAEHVWLSNIEGLSLYL